MYSSLTTQVQIQTTLGITASKLCEWSRILYSLSFGQMLENWFAGPNTELHSAGVQRATAVWQESTPLLYSLLSFVPSALPSSRSCLAL